ncbi:MAG: SDR family oxidoreductase [Phycisphaerales bacterium]
MNNAGGGELVPLGKVGVAEYHTTFMQNASSAAYCTMAAWSGMSKVGQGGRATIVNIASMAVYDPLPGFFAYAAAKSAVAAMTVSAAKEGAACGIEAYCICPGAVETPLLRSIVDTATLPTSDALVPADVADAAIACITGDRRADNGRCIPVLPRTPAMQAWWAEWVRKNPTGWLGMEAVWGSGKP